MLSELRCALAFFLVISLFSLSVPAQTSATGTTETITIRVNEGTNLAFDLAPDGRSIALDLLGQLWLMPASGGTARPITDAVRDNAEDLDPSFSPDGRRVVFRGERNGRTGLWLLDLKSGGPRQLTQLSNPDGYDGNAAWSSDGLTIAFARVVPPDAPGSRPHSAIVLFDVASGTQRDLAITGLPNPYVSNPMFLQGGKEIAFVNRIPLRDRGGRIWIVAAAGGQARPLTEESVSALSPAFAPDGRRLAYFASDSSDRMQVWVQEIDGAGATTGAPRQVTNHTDVTPTRIRWMKDGAAFLYSADGRLWQVAAFGGQPRELRFTAQLSIARRQRALPPPRFPDPGQPQPARGFMGLGLSPDGRQIGMLALGKLWTMPVGGSPRVVADVPFEATALAWAPNGKEVAWSAGVADQEDLFATNLASGTTRRVSALPGREAYPAYSPDGRYLAFVHVQDDGVLRVVDAHATDVTDPAKTQSLGSIGTRWTSTPQWSPESDGLLVCGAAESVPGSRASFIKLTGEKVSIATFPEAPIFLRWPSPHSLVFVRHDRLWQVQFDQLRVLGDPQPVGTAAALYASSSNDGTLLFVSEGGLRLRSPNGVEQKLGWPLNYTAPLAETTLIRNVRIIDGTGTPTTEPQDVLIESGRF